MLNIPPITQLFDMAIGEYGQDYAVGVGTPIYSPVAGTVSTEDQGKKAWGKRLIVHASSGLSFAAGHLTSFVVTAGQKVKAGQLIGYSGGAPTDPSSGVSTGPHIEAQFFKMTAAGATYINPKTVFSQFPAYEKAIFGIGGSSSSVSAFSDSSSSSSSSNPYNPIDPRYYLWEGQHAGDNVVAPLVSFLAGPVVRAFWVTIGIGLFFFGVFLIFAGDIEKAVDQAVGTAKDVGGTVAEVAA